MNEKEMTFWEHLEELRWVLLRILGSVVLLMIVSFGFMPLLFDGLVLAPTDSEFFLYRWFCRVSGQLSFLPDFCNDTYRVDIININVASQFLTHISVSFWFAFVLAFPYILFELWRFVSPALYQNEKKNVGMAFTAGTFMFYLGCVVGYAIVFPLTFRFLTEYRLSEAITNQISLTSYMGNFLMTNFIMGVVFELPLLAWLLSKMGLVDRSFFRRYRRHAVVVLLVLAAVITPSGDPFTLAVVFTPLYLLYELSILVVQKKTDDAGKEKRERN